MQPQKSSYVIIVKAFVQAMIEWFEIDDQTCNIMQSVTKLRGRIWHTSHLLNTMAAAEKVTSKMVSWYDTGNASLDIVCESCSRKNEPSFGRVVSCRLVGIGCEEYSKSKLWCSGVVVSGRLSNTTSIDGEGIVSRAMFGIAKF
jgi:hypothetical protein